MRPLVLTDLRLQQFRKFANPVRLSGLGPGLNLLCAPNEAGKSTLKAALDAALFTRHRVGGQTVEALRTQGNDVPPVVQVGFSLDGQPFTLTKRFFRQHRARLERPDGSVAEGDAAEKELEALLGFETLGGRGARAEALGVWGLLWVAQGESFLLPEVAASARGSLEESLAGGEVAAITGGARGHRAAEQVRAELARFLTPNNRRPTKRYAEVLQELDRAQADLEAAQKAKEELAGFLLDLDASRRERETAEYGVNPEEEEHQIQRLRENLVAAQQQASQVETAKVNVALAEQTLAAAQDGVSRRQETARLAQAAAAAATTAAETNKARSEAVKAAGEAQKLAEAAFTEADRAWRSASQTLQNITALAQWQRQKDASAEKQIRLEQALAAAKESAAAQREAEKLLATDAAIKKLRLLVRKRDEAAAARAAAATVLQFSLTAEGEAALWLDGSPVDAAGDVAITRAAELDLGPLGKIEVRPGVQDAAAIDQALADANETVNRALDTLECGSLVEAESQAEQRQSLLQQAGAASDRSRAYAPEFEGDAGRIGAALETLAAEIQAAENAMSELAVPDREILPEDATSILRETEQERQDRYDGLARANQALALAEQSAQQAQSALAGAEADNEAAATAVRAARASQSDEQLLEHMRLAKAALDDAQNHHREALEQAQNTGEPAGIEATISRMEKARTNRQQRVAKLRENIASLEAMIRAHSDRGPDEAIRDAEGCVSRLTVERERIERDVAALQLLDNVLREAQSRVESRYLAPLTAKLRPHLSALFGQAEVGMAGDFSLRTLNRDRFAEEVSQLSAGTQEQLAILSRIAFAEVLAEQGRPVVLLLDDALVYADDRRIQDMFGALEQAAEHFQVIVLSCRHRVFDGLGGANQRLLSIERCDPIDV